jgi:hypothetical protein
MAALSACAFSRSEITIAPESSTQPAGGVAVVVNPTDARRFEAAPSKPSIPSLKEPSQINDPQITSRAVGRKRNEANMRNFSSTQCRGPSFAFV